MRFAVDVVGQSYFRWRPDSRAIAPARRNNLLRAQGPVFAGAGRDAQRTAAESVVARLFSR